MSIDVMVDLETMGTRNNSVIVSMGAVAFDPQGPRVVPDINNTFSRNIDIQSCLDLGLEVEGSTIYWWLRQSADARQSLVNPNPIDIKMALRDFSKWYASVKTKDTHIWSHGATFDIPMIAENYHRIDEQQPWLFYNANDTRTIFRLAKLKLPSADARIGGHNSLQDAIAQAIHLQKCLGLLMGLKTVPSEPVNLAELEEVEF